MTNRIIELSSNPAHVSVSNGLLTIDAADQPRFQIPPEDVAAVVAAHYAVTFTREAVAALADHGAQLIVCDKHGMPAAMLLPLRGFHQPATRLAAQAAAKLPLRKRLWRQIIRSKIGAQAALLQRLRSTDAGLLELARRVRSGDAANAEGLAARIYWLKLFGDDFKRDPDAFDHNRLLNYGYGVLRALTCRAICAAGLHPGLGLHHHHRANPFCLADDLIEPFRPIVDAIVFNLWQEQLGMAELTPAIKQRLLQILKIRLVLADEERGIFDVLTRLSLSLASVIEGRRKSLALPDWSLAAPPDQQPNAP